MIHQVLQGTTLSLVTVFIHGTGTVVSLITYTTVGYGDVVLPQKWRLFGGSEALVGILMTAWSTALLLGVVNALHAKIIEKWRTSEQTKKPKGM